MATCQCCGGELDGNATVCSHFCASELGAGRIHLLPVGADEMESIVTELHKLQARGREVYDRMRHLEALKERANRQYDAAFNAHRSAELEEQRTRASLQQLRATALQIRESANSAIAEYEEIRARALHLQSQLARMQDEPPVGRKRQATEGSRGQPQDSVVEFMEG